MDQKAQLIETGLELFSSQSFNATGVRQITKAAGVPTGSFHYYFKNKEDFALALLDQFFEKSFSETMSRILFDNSINARKKLFESFRVMIDHHNEKGNECGTVSSCIMGNMGQELSNDSPVIAEKIKEYYGRIAFGIKTMIEMGQQDGSIEAHHDAKQLAPFIFDAYEGALLRRKIERSNRPLEDFMNNLEMII